MSFKKWRPWHLIVKLAAGRYGFIDPVTLLARLRQFGRPSEVAEPLELLRAGLIFHARGVINTRAIQYNLDWVWPYWVVKQFTPGDASFIPRGFSISHINLTHRNWTAVGHPDLSAYPVIDPRGLVTPLFDSWSIDAWVLSDNGDLLLPSHLKDVSQRLDMENNMAVVTQSRQGSLELETRSAVVFDESDQAFLQTDIAGLCPETSGWIVVSIRPYNPEGIQFIDQLDCLDRQRTIQVNGAQAIEFETAPEKILFSTYEAGDVAFDLNRSADRENQVNCPIGMATAAAFFPIDPSKHNRIRYTVDLNQTPSVRKDRTPGPVRSYAEVIDETAGLCVPDPHYQFLYDAAVRTLLLLTSEEVYPGPYTYRRFWFRDACLMINALLGLGLEQRSRQLISRFPGRQNRNGYFQSQEGEWDSNGQVLWLAERLFVLTGRLPEKDLMSSLMKGARWIVEKRRTKNDGKRHDGLLPAGFSAEHLGPNDHYYWDDFWGVAGLRAAARLSDAIGDNPSSRLFFNTADQFEFRIFESMKAAPGYKKFGAIPASPYRRMDSGAVGSLVADYPLQITDPKDPRIMNTVEYLMRHSFVDHGFFQEMIHSGINVYLTLDIAQTLLRSGDERFQLLMDKTAKLASPTGQWPEAVNPVTGGGCMGDGQHGWAAAEWIMMMRSIFVREECRKLILGSGLLPEWLEKDGELRFGPTLVPGGYLSLRFVKAEDRLTLFLSGRRPAGHLECLVKVPGYRPRQIDTSWKQCLLEPR